MAKKTLYKWYTKTLKSGKVKRFARGKGGRYARWEDADTLDRPDGEYKMINIIINFVPTKGGMGTPISESGDNFEVNLELPEGDYTTGDYQEMGENAMRQEGFNDYMIESCSVQHKMGKDFVGYSKSDDVTYKIIDLTRMQYRYPRNGRGKLGDETE
jgi:hypothetical protein